MHPDKFLGRDSMAEKPQMSLEERGERLQELCKIIAGKRKDAVDARKSSGIEAVWLNCEEAYLGIDDMNRHEFAEAKWAKPTSMTGPLTSNRVVQDDSRSNAYVRLSSRYVDNASAKLCEILLPIDDKAFSFEPTPEPDLVKQMDDLTPLVHQMTGQPVMKAPDDQAQPQGQPAQATVADQAEAIIAQAMDSAKKAENRIYDWMVESKYPAEARKVVHDSSRLGAGVLKGPFPDIKQSRAATKMDDGIALQIQKKIVPTLKWVDIWNIFPDDACGEDIHHGDYIFERDFLSEKMLMRLCDDETYLKEQIKQVIEEGPGKIYAEAGNPNEKKNRKRYEIWYYYGLIKRHDLELLIKDQSLMDDLPDDMDSVHVIISMVNDTVIRAIINPMDSGTFPYRVMTWSRRPGYWAGVGVAEQIQMPQRLVNAATRAMLNNAGLSAGPQIIIDELAVRPADGSTKLYPNKMWLATGEGGDVTKAFMSVQIPSVEQEMSRIIQYGMQLAEESSGIPLITQGQSGPTTPDTFGAAELQDNNAHTWLRSVGYRYDDQITEPIVNDMYEWLLLDPSVPNDEKGDFQINAHGSIAMVERAIQEQVFLGLLKATENPAFKLDPSKTMAQYLKAKRLDPREVQYTDAEQKQMAQQPPPPPVQVQVAQVNAQSKLQAVQMEQQSALQQQQQEMSHEQQLLQTGGATPHQANAMANIERERIRAESAANTQQLRSQTELARAQKEQDIAYQNGQMDIQKLQLQQNILILQLQQKSGMALKEIQANLATVAMQEQTKRQLGAGELSLAQNEGEANRAVDVHKHENPVSVQRDEMSTDVTP